MIEVISRSVRQAAAENQIDGRRAQVSFNSDGRLVIRVIGDLENDVLVVLNKDVTLSVFNFAEIINHGRIKPKAQIPGVVNSDDIPF